MIDPEYFQLSSAADYFDGGDGNGSSVGTGSSDQGIEPGEENQEDEFRHGTPSAPLANDDDIAEEYAEGGPRKQDEQEDAESSESHGAGSLDKGFGGINTKPAHGLVEEGPGPDS
jgi:hypothetical protein